MKIHTIVLANSRAPQNLNRVQFNGKGKLELRDQITGENKKKSSGICLQEMSLVFSCFKKNNFKEDLCAKELSNFKKCFKEAKNSQSTNVAEENKFLSNVEVNKLLERFPNK